MKRSSLVLAGLLMPAAVLAQLPDPSTRALGMGGAYSSLARGYEAVMWNPAMLGTWGRPGFTIGLPQVDVEVGSNTYGFADFKKYANSYLTNADKQSLLAKIKLNDSLNVRTFFGAAPFGLSIGNFALAVGMSGQGELSVGRDAVELALFGNVRRLGAGQFLVAHPASGSGWAATTAAASLAIPFPLPVGRLSVGVTGKYVIGNALGSAADLGTRIGANPRFSATEAAEAIYTEYARSCKNPTLGGSGPCSLQAGKGFGADLGAVLQFTHGVTLSAVVVNAVGKMTWNTDRLVYERMVSNLTQDSTGIVKSVKTDSTRLTTEAAITADPRAKALRDSLLAHADFAKLARVGVALKSGALTLAGQMQLRLASGLDQQPSQLVSAGAEYRVLGFLPLRVGASWDFGEATMLAAGTGLQLFGLNLDASIANFSGSVHPGVRLGFGAGLIF